jgi:hypothetical protein
MIRRTQSGIRRFAMEKDDRALPNETMGADYMIVRDWFGLVISLIEIQGSRGLLDRPAVKMAV